MAAKEKVVSRINRIENENRELKAKLEKYETGALQSDVPDSVVWGMYLSIRRTNAKIRERLKNQVDVNKRLRADSDELSAKRQNVKTSKRW